MADIGKTDQEGLALIRALRSLPPGSANRDIPALALTAFASLRELDEAIAAGFNSHIGKPMDAAQLIVAIAASVGVDLEA